MALEHRCLRASRIDLGWLARHRSDGSAEPG